MDERQVILQVQDVSKDFDIKSKEVFGKKQTLHALTNVNLSVYRGETLGIIGESGCGKSTLGRCMVRLHKPTRGSILCDGVDIFALKGEKQRDLCRDIQMIFQDPYSSLDPRRTAAYSVAEPLKVHGILKNQDAIDERVLELMQEVGLDLQHLSRYPHEFSGGQRQRINIARAIALNPKVIVCDEPVSALDVSIQAQVINLFKRLQREHGLTYVFISHDLGIIKYISDRIAIMYLGRVVELCSAEAIYRKPLHPYTKALLSAIPPESPFDKKKRMVLEGDIPSPIGAQIGCPLAGRCPSCMERCKQEAPELKDRGEGHQVACFLYD